MLVFGDSLTFHGPQRPHPLTDPRLYPNVLAQALALSVDPVHLAPVQLDPVHVDVVARPGWTARDAWWALTKDPNVATVLAPAATVVVLGLGQMDQLPAAIPTYLRDGIAYLRPGWLRRAARDAYRAAGPPVIRATGGRLRQLPQAATDTYLERITQAVRLLSPLGASLPVVLLGPSPYSAAAYPSQRPHAPAVAAARRWAGRHQVSFVDLDPLVGPSLAAGTGNPDGMHWGWQAHHAVGEAVAAAVVAAVAAETAGG